MRCSRTVAAIGVVVAVVGSAQVAAAATSARTASSETVTGTVRRAVVDVHPDVHPGEDEHTDEHEVADVQVTVVETPDGTVQVPTSALDHVATGATVTVVLGATTAPRAATPEARAESGRAVRSVRVLPTTLAAAPTDTSPRNVQPVLVDVTGTSADGTTAADLTAAVGEVSRFYDHETHGAVTYTSLTPVRVTVAASAVSRCDLATLERAVRAQVRAGATTTLLMRTPDVESCGFSGVAWVGSTSARGLALWLNGSTVPLVAAHEIGHTLGLGHSGSSASCARGQADDGDAATCTTVEYGDFFDVMGNGAYAARSSTPNLGEMTASQRDRIGGFAAGELAAVDPARTSTTTLAAVGAGTGVQALRFTTTSGTYYVELRSGAGRDAALYPGGRYFQSDPSGTAVPVGVTVRRLDEDAPGALSRLLEPRAAGAAFTLPAGSTFATEDGAAVVTTTAVTGTGAGATATVRVAPSGTPATEAPAAPVVSTVRAGDGTLRFTLVPAATDGTVTGLRATTYLGGVAQGTRTLDATSTGDTLTGLVNGRSYVLGVGALGPGGESAETLVGPVTPRAAPPVLTRGTRGLRS